MQSDNERDVKLSLEFVKDSQDFFAAPFLQETKFKRWMKGISSSERANIIILLSTLTKKNPDFESALVGTSPEDIHCLFCGDTRPLSNLLHTNPALVQNLLTFKEKMNFFDWRWRYLDLICCTKYMESIIIQLQVLKLKARFKKYPQNIYEDEVVTKFIEQIKKEILLVKIDMFQFEDTKELIGIFKRRLLKAIENLTESHENITELHKDILLLNAYAQDNCIFGVQPKNTFFRSEEHISQDSTQLQERTLSL